MEFDEEVLMNCVQPGAVEPVESMDEDLQCGPRFFSHREKESLTRGRKGTSIGYRYHMRY